MATEVKPFTCPTCKKVRMQGCRVISCGGWQLAIRNYEQAGRIVGDVSDMPFSEDAVAAVEAGHRKLYESVQLIQPWKSLKETKRDVFMEVTTPAFNAELYIADSVAIAQCLILLSIEDERLLWEIIGDPVSLITKIVKVRVESTPLTIEILSKLRSLVYFNEHYPHPINAKLRELIYRIHRLATQ